MYPPTSAAPANVHDQPSVLQHLIEHLEEHTGVDGRIVDEDGGAATGYIIAGNTTKGQETTGDCNSMSSSADVSFINSTSAEPAQSGYRTSRTNYAIPRPTESFSNITGIFRVFDPASAQPTSSADTTADFIPKEAIGSATETETVSVGVVGANTDTVPYRTSRTVEAGANTSGVVRDVLSEASSKTAEADPLESALSAAESAISVNVSDDTAADVDYVPCAGTSSTFTDSAKTTASESGTLEASINETYHDGKIGGNLRSYKRGSRSQQDNAINQWITMASGSRGRGGDRNPRKAAVIAKAKIRSDLISRQDRYEGSYTRPDTPRGSVAAAATAATAAASSSSDALNAFHKSAREVSHLLDQKIAKSGAASPLPHPETTSVATEVAAAFAAFAASAAAPPPPTPSMTSESVAAQSYPIAAARSSKSPKSPSRPRARAPSPASPPTPLLTRLPAVMPLVAPRLPTPLLTRLPAVMPLVAPPPPPPSSTVAVPQLPSSPRSPRSVPSVTSLYRTTSPRRGGIPSRRSFLRPVMFMRQTTANNRKQPQTEKDHKLLMKYR